MLHDLTDFIKAFLHKLADSKSLWKHYGNAMQSIYMYFFLVKMKMKKRGLDLHAVKAFYKFEAKAEEKRKDPA